MLNNIPGIKINLYLNYNPLDGLKEEEKNQKERYIIKKRLLLFFLFDCNKTPVNFVFIKTFDRSIEI